MYLKKKHANILLRIYFPSYRHFKLEMVLYYSQTCFAGFSEMHKTKSGNLDQVHSDKAHNSWLFTVFDAHVILNSSCEVNTPRQLASNSRTQKNHTINTKTQTKLFM